MNKILYMVFSLFVTCMLCAILFRTTDWQEVIKSISGMDVKWIVISQCCVWLSYFSRVQRWHYIIRPVMKIPYRILFNATQIGFLINVTIPARIGEAVRALVLSKLSKIHLSQSIVMVAIDRVSDLLFLIIVMPIALLSSRFQSDVIIPTGLLNNHQPIVISRTIVTPTVISLICICFGTLFFLIFTYRKHNWMFTRITRWVDPVSIQWSERLKNLLLKIVKSLAVFKSLPDIAGALLFSFITWGFLIGGSAALLCAFHIQFSWATPIIIIIMTAVIISIPVTTGLIGQYHLAVVAALIITNPHLSYDTMRTYAIAAHVLSLIPIAVLGIYALFYERLHFYDLIGQINKIRIKSYKEK